MAMDVPAGSIAAGRSPAVEPRSPGDIARSRATSPNPRAERKTSRANEPWSRATLPRSPATIAAPPATERRPRATEPNPPATKPHSRAAQPNPPATKARPRATLRRSRATMRSSPVARPRRSLLLPGGWIHEEPSGAPGPPARRDFAAESAVGPVGTSRAPHLPLAEAASGGDHYSTVRLVFRVFRVVPSGQWRETADPERDVLRKGGERGG